MLSSALAARLSPWSAKAEEILETEAGGMRARFKVVTQGIAVGGENLPIAPAAAGAWWAIRVERHKAEFAGHAIETQNQSAVRHDSRANALRYGNDDHMTAFHVVEPDGCQHARIRRVFELDLNSGGVDENFPNIKPAPLQAGANVRRSRL